MKNKTTKKGINMKEENNKLAEEKILATLIKLYENQENIKITAKIINTKSGKQYLYNNGKIN